MSLLLRISHLVAVVGILSSPFVSITKAFSASTTLNFRHYDGCAKRQQNKNSDRKHLLCQSNLYKVSIEQAFVRQQRSTLYAKKGRSSGSKGFGETKAAQPKRQTQETSNVSASTKSSTTLSPTNAQNDFILQSISSTPNRQNEMTDEAMSKLSPEERTAAILRNQYGLKTLAEQQMNAKQLANYKEEQKRLKDIKKKIELNQDIDIMSILPGGLIIAIDNFLTIGVVICGIIFVLAGVAITAEAYGKATGNGFLPSNAQEFIVSTIEPNFTPFLFVLLGFSVSLGLFAALKLSSQGATYREE